MTIGFEESGEDEQQQSVLLVVLFDLLGLVYEISEQGLECMRSKLQDDNVRISLYALTLLHGGTSHKAWESVAGEQDLFSFCWKPDAVRCGQMCIDLVLRGIFLGMIEWERRGSQARLTK